LRVLTGMVFNSLLFSLLAGISRLRTPARIDRFSVALDGGGRPVGCTWL
jgi:hypothetical protein